ncbi:MAG: HNH endonuclease signature motif containing protein [Halobacteria archaeon]|nr:HNH endonuclease signature motif containing protein [Halobacteria archaeon]
MNMNRQEVWKLKEHVCVACGKDLDEDSFEIYYRDGNSENTDADNVDLVCNDCHERLDKSSRGDTELILEEIEEEMPDASPKRKTLEYLRRSQE